MTDVSFLGEFRCSELEPVQLDGCLAFAINRADLEASRPLQKTKWWDYRYVHPGSCFFLYAHHFGQNVEKWRSMFGINPNFRMRASDHPIWRTEREGLKAIRVLAPASHRTGLWRGMCHADQYGIPYDFWISRAFDIAFQFKWERMPTPNNIYSPLMARQIVELWEKDSAELLYLPKDPRYLAANFEGDPTQAEFQRWLLTRIKARPNPVITLCNFLVTEPLVYVPMARTILGNPVVDEAIRRTRIP